MTGKANPHFEGFEKNETRMKMKLQRQEFLLKNKVY